MALVSPAWVNDQWMTASPPMQIDPPAFLSVLLDAAADRVTMVGRFLHQSSTAQTVNGVGFSFGTVSKTQLSTFKVSLQDVDVTTGPVIREDGTPDQTLSIANADAGFASNTWYEAGFDAAATRSLTYGNLIAVVFQFDSFVAGDTVNIRGLRSGLSTLTAFAQGSLVGNTTGTYAVTSLFPNVVLRCADGTYGTIENSFVCSALTAHSFAANTGVADEYALGFQYPFPVKVSGLWFLAVLGTAADSTEALLYSGTTALSTTTIDHNALSAATARVLTVPFPPQTLVANALYRIALRPTANNTITLYSFDVANANHLQCHPGGVNAHLWTRLDQGAWGGEVTTRRLFAGVRPSAFDDGAGGGKARIIGG